jgi:hypothetical protein
VGFSSIGPAKAVQPAQLKSRQYFFRYQNNPMVRLQAPKSRNELEHDCLLDVPERINALVDCRPPESELDCCYLRRLTQFVWASATDPLNNALPVDQDEHVYRW